MGKLYFTRHGETETNVKKLVCGNCETNLTENGLAQANALGKEIKAKIDSGKIHIDQILCSPLSRARITAEHISKITGIPLKIEELLVERNFGSFEWKSRESPEFKKSLQSFALSFGREEGGESYLKVAQRIYNLLDSLTKSPENKEKTFLLVAHNGLSRIIQSYFYDMTNEDFAAFGITNCQLLEFEF